MSKPAGPRHRGLLLLVIPAMLVVLSLAVPGSALAARCSESLAYAPNVAPRCEQYRYARETGLMTAQQFMQRKADFVANGCVTPGGGCKKPAPYNAFDWTTDGCSQTPASWKAIFDAPCEQHDFGYRNFGKGLTLQRTELRRLKVDNVFYREMKRICSGWSRGSQKVACYVTARAMYLAVRSASYWG